VGLRTVVAGRYHGAVALWALDIASELLFVGDAGTTEPSRPSRRRGVEWSNALEVTRWLTLDADLAWSKARFTDGDPAGDRIPGAIEGVVSAGLTVHDRGRWSGSLHLRYFGPRPLVEDNSQRSGSTTLAALRVGYRFAKDTKVALDVYNLFDRKASDIDYYYASRLQGEAAGGVNDVHFHPVEPRSVRVTLSASF